VHSNLPNEMWSAFRSKRSTGSARSESMGVSFDVTFADFEVADPDPKPQVDHHVVIVMNKEDKAAL
jgi:hypothetical protein